MLSQGYHVARLAADLQDFILALDLQVCPCSSQAGLLIAHCIMPAPPDLKSLLHDRIACSDRPCVPSQEVTLVGSSMGCAVIWAYMELFDYKQRVSKAVFVDQVII